jgi:hypothetical protein
MLVSRFAKPQAADGQIKKYEKKNALSEQRGQGGSRRK